VRRLDYYWRLFATGLSFTLFGVGGFFIGFIVFPLVHLFSRGKERAQRRCQRIVSGAFRLFIWTMKSLGVLTYEISGAARLAGPGPGIIVANHPSLIDVIFIIAQMPQALCIVKKAAWSNPAMMGVMWSTGYVPNDAPEQLIEDCARRVREGEKLVVFPEGTRTQPGKPMKFRRGAASIIVKSGAPFTPVAISIKPSTLTKADKWYDVPPERVRMRLAVGEPVDPRGHIVEGESLSQASRRMNRLLKQVLTEGVERHERAD